MTKKILLPILILLSVLSLSGCMLSEPPLSPQMSLREIALSQMEERYGLIFEYYRPFGNSLSGTHMFLARTESIPDQVITIEIERFRYPDRVLMNNFLAVKHKDATIEFLYNRVTDVFNNSNIFYDVAQRGLSQGLPPNATLYEFLADTRIHLVVRAEIKESDFISNEQVMKVAKLIAESGVHFILTIVVVEDDLFGSFTHETLRRLIPLRHFVHCAQVAYLGEDLRLMYVRDDRWVHG